MKRLIALLLVLIWSCGATKNAAQPTSAILTSDCPKQARCSLTLLAGKTMAIQSESTGLRYNLVDQPGTTVIIYKYDKIVKGNLQDAGYREEIVFEYDGTLPLSLADAQLQNVKMLFGRFCYCKGQTGYYAVRNGQLLIGDDGKAQLHFNVSEVPQIIKDISFALQ